MGRPRKSPNKKTTSKQTPTIQNKKEATKNGLGGAIGFENFAGLGFPGNQGTPWSVQLSNVNTLFKNLRWYLVSNFRQLLSELYVEIGLVQTIVDVPTDDAFRGGVTIKSKELDEDEIQDLQSALEKDDDYYAASQATKWNRLFGGAGVIIITDQDPSTPLNIEAIGNDTPLEFRPVDMWELYFDLQNTEGPGPQLDREDTEFYSYYGVQLHRTRVLKLNGLQAPSFIRPRLRGWGYSIVEKLVRSINQYLKSNDLGFEVLDEFKLDVYKIKNLTNTLLSPQGEEQVRQRIQLANWQKNYQNAVVMDSEDDFDHKQLSFAGLAEAMTGIRMQVASDMRIPLTKLFGISAAGFNSGEDDIEVYNAMVESEVRTKIKWHLLKMIQIKCQKLFGFIPDDLSIDFKPLRILTAEQEENVKTQKFSRLLQAKQSGEITRFEFREGCNKDNLLSVSLDTTADKLNPDDPDVATLVSGDNNEENLPDADNLDSEVSEFKAPVKGPSSKNAPLAKVPNELSKDPFADFKGPKIVTVGVLSGSQILTGKRNDNGLWTSPGGHIDEGESIEGAACREVWEESGIKILPQDLKHISSEKINSHRTGKDFVVHAFLATVDKDAVTTKLDPDQEISEWRWVNIDPKTPELLNENRHAKSDAILSHLFKLKNGYEVMITSLSDKENKYGNSAKFDRASYAADGGDAWIDYRKKEFYENPGKKVDEALWEKAKAASREAFGKEKWQFVTWYYKKHGGKFSFLNH